MAQLMEKRIQHDGNEDRCRRYDERDDGDLVAVKGKIEKCIRGGVAKEQIERKSQGTERFFHKYGVPF